MKFGEWLPDRDPLDNPGIVECKNLVPDTYYRPMRGLTPLGTAMTEACLGAFSGKDDSGASFNFAGTADKMYQLDGSDWTQINTLFATSAENRWHFDRFGDLIIATNRDDAIQKFDLGSDSAFSTLSGSPPKAKHIGVVRDFLVLSNLDTGANIVKWSGINDATEWTTGVGESDSQVIPEGGPIKGFQGGEYGLVFQENQIVRMDYQGPPYGFSFEKIEDNIGTIAAGSVIKRGIYTYFLDQNGFYVTDGSHAKPIGGTKIDKYFFQKLDQQFLYKISSTIDPINKVVIWAYVGIDSLDEQPNWLIMFNWETGRWSEAEASLETLFNSLSTGVTLDDLDALYADLDSIDVSLDSRLFQGGSLILAAVDTNHKLAAFTGDILEAVIKTGFVEISPMRFTLLQEVWPEIDGTIQVQAHTMFNYQAAVVSSGYIDVNSIGFAPFLENARLHQLEFKFTPATKASGFKLKAVAKGGY